MTNPEGQFDGHDDELSLSLAHSDPVVMELNRLQNLLKGSEQSFDLLLLSAMGVSQKNRVYVMLRQQCEFFASKQELNQLCVNTHEAINEKDRELGTARGEIKSLKATDALKDKAIEELKNEVHKLEDRLGIAENLLEQRNLENKKLASERREALAAQYAAEATLRRVHANQRDDDLPPMESVIAPLEAEIKILKNEVAALQEDKKMLERLTKSKELALIEAEKILRSALERALIVEEVQNHNYELKRQIEICQEENKILEKTNRQKVLEVEKLSQTIKELEEAILAGGAVANSVRDYRRQISELNEEKKTLERELARAKVLANRVATVVANEWKNDSDKVMPIKQWLEERRILQAEMQRLRDKLAISERTAKAEAQLKDKFKLRLRTMEEGLKQASSISVSTNALSASPKIEKSHKIFGFLTSNSGVKKRSTSQPRASTVRGSPLRQPKIQDEMGGAAGEPTGASNLREMFASEEYAVKKCIWVSRNKVVDSTGKENAEVKTNLDESGNKSADEHKTASVETKTKSSGNEELESQGSAKMDTEDMVSGFLYDRLQKEIISLRKSSESKDRYLNAKDQEIQMLVRKVDTLAKAIEVESKKIKRETASRERDAVRSKADENKNVKITRLTHRTIKA